MLIGVAFDLDVDNLIMACMVRSHPCQAISVRLIGRKDVCDFFPRLKIVLLNDRLVLIEGLICTLSYLRIALVLAELFHFA